MMRLHVEVELAGQSITKLEAGRTSLTKRVDGIGGLTRGSNASDLHSHRKLGILHLPLQNLAHPQSISQRQQC